MPGWHRVLGIVFRLFGRFSGLQLHFPQVELEATFAATQLPAPHTPQPPAPAHSLNQPLTLAEVEVGLQHLHNGRSRALHGYTSELLRYAQLVATPDDPAPAQLLAPCLVVLFNAAFTTGQVPQS